MWFTRSKSKSEPQSQSRSAPAPPKFGRSSFKDVHTLLSDQRSACAAADHDPAAPGIGNAPILHRSRSSNNLLRTLSNPTFLLNESLQTAEAASRIQPPPGADRCVVVYFTSLRIVRRTFEDCNTLRSMLQSFRVPIDERDISIDSQYADELRRILGATDSSRLPLPRVFIDGRYVGGAEEMRRLFNSGELHKWLSLLPAAKPGTCEACGDMRFVLCEDCDGSHKCYSEKSEGFRTCTSCNEHGLIRCPSCSFS
ncbi:uncharacterized protein At5g39865-like [Andrographis paniculata]|uniref:uncharacterized protein At5g39865-like n=1 Tax=Andrographis paniculata TaxID=175694 RepID=UPI0021E86719|nr:uncharacterized protein At5g39865-like [Andrographis paniculata]